MFLVLFGRRSLHPFVVNLRPSPRFILLRPDNQADNVKGELIRPGVIYFILDDRENGEELILMLQDAKGGYSSRS